MTIAYLRQPNLERVIASTVPSGEGREEVMSAVRQVIAKAFEGEVYPLGKINLLEHKKKDLSMQSLLTLRENFVVSLARFAREKGWDPKSLPLSAEFIVKHPRQHFLLNDALGWVAIAWQVHVHPSNLVLTRGDYQRYLQRGLNPVA